MRNLALALVLAARIPASAVPSAPAAQATDAATVIARCAEAMGGEARIRALKSLRLEVLYPDHGGAAVLMDILRPNLFRTDRPGEYAAVFDGKEGVLLKFDPKNPGSPPVAQALPVGAAKGFETDLVWFVPAFFDFPAEYGGLVESKGAKCHRLTVTLPLGTQAVYLVDAKTNLIKTIAVDEVYEGKTHHLEREWLEGRTVQGIHYPRRMTYPGRGGKTAVAEIRKIEFNPVLPGDRFKIPGPSKPEGEKRPA